jgi:hypothetical protein
MSILVLLLLTSCAKEKPLSLDDALKILQSGQYHIEGVKIYEDGTQVPIVRYAGNGMYATSIIENTRYVTRDGIEYRLYELLNICSLNDPTDHTSTYSQTEYKSSGTAEFNQKSLTYDEFRVNATTDMRVFHDGKKVAGIEYFYAEGGYSVYEIYTVFYQNVPDSVFEIPEDYEVQDRRIPAEAGAD